MMQILYQREILIDAPLAHVWPLVATEDGLRQWWGNGISLEPREGGRCEEWRPHGEKLLHWQGIVTHYTPPHQLTLTLRSQEPGNHWPELTTISIALEAKGEQTLVDVTQRAFGAMPQVDTRMPDATELGEPIQPRMSPLASIAQLERIHSGSLPRSIPMPLAPSAIIPELITREQSHTLTLWWQKRFASLAATASAITK